MDHIPSLKESYTEETFFLAERALFETSHSTKKELFQAVNQALGIE